MKLRDSFRTYTTDAGEHLLVSSDNSDFAGLARGNKTAAFIVDALRDETTPQEIAQAMARVYDAPVEQIERDVEAVIEALRQMGALENDSARSTSTPAPSSQSFEDQLDKHGSFIYRNVGSSMQPLIKQGRDLVVIGRKPHGRCKRFDVVLYRRNERYILHRIVEVLPDSYVICGDNCVNREYGITDKDIIGVMVAVIRNGRRIDADSLAQQRYAHLWHAAHPLRTPLMRAKGKLRRIARKL